MKQEPPHDEPLPATLIFVFGLAAFIVIGWYLMFMLEKARW